MQVRSDSLLSRHMQHVSQAMQRAAAQQGASIGESDEVNPFLNLLGSGITKVSAMQDNAHSQIESLLTGGDVNQAEVFTSVQKADMSFRLLVQIRNKLMQAYEELNSIRV